MASSSLRARAELELRRRRRREKWRRYADDPVGFAEALGLTVWGRQREVLEAAQNHQRVAVRGGRKISKSTTIAVLALHNAVCLDGPTLLTSSSYDQLKRIVWREIRMIAERAGLPVEVPLDPITGFDAPGGGLVSGRSVNRAVNMQGYSGHTALYIGDEASGLSLDIVDALEGNLAGGGRLVLFGNPTETSGPFFDAFSAPNSTWHAIRISSRESPNVTGEASVPGLALPGWIAEKEEQYGKESPFVRVHIDGEFPLEGENAVIPLRLVEAARARADVPPTGRLHVGVDVAYTGSDKSVVFARRGHWISEPEETQGMDPLQVADMARRVVSRYRQKGERPIVKIDVIGIGAGTYAALKRDTNIDAVPVNVATAATSRPAEGGYRKLRDQMWFAMRDWLEEGGMLPAEHDLVGGDLMAPSYSFDAQGRYVVESKEEIKSRLGRSPDYADALALSVYDPPNRSRRVGVSGMSKASAWRD